MSDSNDNVKFGFDCVMYISAGADTTSWVDCPNIRNCTTSGSYSEDDVTRRGSAGVKESEPALEEVSLDFDLLFNKQDTSDFELILAAKSARTALSVMALDGLSNVAGSQGPKGNFKVFKFERTEDIEGHVAYAVTLKPCLESALTWHEVSA